MKSTLVSKNISVMGRRTSIRLEPDMWQALKEISIREQCSTNDICSLIDYRKDKNTSLTAAIRVFIMLYFRAAATEEGHVRAGHGNFLKMVERARANDIKHSLSAYVRKSNDYPIIHNQIPDYRYEDRTFSQN